MTDPAPDAERPGRPLSGAAAQSYRGQAIGLSATGRGSLAGTGARLGAYLVDAVASALVAGLFVHQDAAHRTGTFADRLPGAWSLVPFAIDYVVGMLVAGRTLGMYLLGLRVVRVTPDAGIGPARALVRTVLLCLLVPALVFDRDNRGLQDRLTDTAVVRN